MFFHRIANANGINNFIHKVRFDGGLVNDEEKVKRGVADYFKNLFQEGFC